MHEATHLEKAPIKEAVIDIRVNADIDTDDLKSIEHNMPTGYGEFTPTLRQGFGINFSEKGIQTTQDELLLGYRSEDKERGFVVQFQRDGFSLSKLAPYDTWPSFKQEAMSLWQLYRPLTTGSGFKRLAVRYINEVCLPFTDSKLDFDDYITSCPRVPQGMPDLLMDFATRIVVPFEESLSVAVIASRTNGKNDEGIQFVLDIDVYRASQLGLSEKELWEFFDSLRDIKNKAFFGSVTERFKEMCR